MFQNIFIPFLFSIISDLENSRRTAIVQATEKVSPAVVSITAQSTRYIATSPFWSDPFFDFWRGLLPPAYRKEKIVSLGSGVIVSPDGYIITNQHVIEDADQIYIILSDGRKFKAKLIGEDKRLDLALLKINATDLPYVKFFNSDSLLIGEWVVALGNPFGFYIEDPSPTITVGVVSALHRTIHIEDLGEREYYDMIQTDASINPGNSGGPLVNILGEVVGLNTFIISKSGGNEGIGFAIPSNTVIKAIEEFKKYGKFRHAFWGFSCQELTKGLRRAVGYKGIGGVLVKDVFFKNSGLKEGDVILKINGRRIYNLGDIRDITYALVPGERLRIEYVRHRKRGEAIIRAREIRMEKLRLEEFGITVGRITPELAAFYQLPASSGLLILKVFPNSYAQEFGLKKGDIILNLNGKMFEDLHEFKKAMEEPGIKNLVIQRGNQKFNLTFRKY